MVLAFHEIEPDGSEYLYGVTRGELERHLGALKEMRARNIANGEAGSGKRCEQPLFSSVYESCDMTTQKDTNEPTNQ